MGADVSKRLGALLLGCSMGALATPALAQDAERDGLDEIIVTAQRTEERLQDVPVAVTAFNADLLAQTGIAEIEDVGLHVPNVQMREESGVGGLTIAIRGINVSAENFSFDSAVGVYVNEVFIARSNDFTSSFYDVNSVQVLRGPQGTLFGRNTPAGAVLVNTRLPGDEFGGYALVSGGFGGGGLGRGAERGFYRYEGGVDIPVSEQLAFRVAGFYENDDGWARSAFSGYHNSSRDDFAFRGTMLYRPTSNLEASLIVDRSEFERGAALHVPVQLVAGNYAYDLLFGGTATRDAVAAGIADGIDPYETNHELGNSDMSEGESTSATLRVTYDISDNWQLRSITGWRDIARTSANESDGTPFPSAATPSILEQTQYSQEFVVTGDLTETLNLLAGVFYFQETGLDQNTIRYNITDPAGAPPPFIDPLVLRGEDFDNVSQAVFANLAWSITPNITLAGGIRYTEEEKSVFVNSYRATSGGILAQGPESFSDQVTLYDLRLDWQISSDLLVYGKFSTGYRAGGIGFRAADAQFEPETAETYEVGFKSDFDLIGGPARLNVALFHTTYQDFQVPVVLTGPTRQTVVNAGEATMQGAEIEFTYEPIDNLRVSTAVGLLDAGYDEFIFNNVSLGGLVDLTNNELRGAPETTASGSIAYTLPSSIGEWLFRVDYGWRSQHELDTVYQTNAPILAARTSAFHQDAYGILDARIRLAQAFGTGVDISLFGSNLTDEVYKVYALHSSPTRMVVFGEPRTYGLEFRASF